MKIAQVHVSSSCSSAAVTLLSLRLHSGTSAAHAFNYQVSHTFLCKSSSPPESSHRTAGFWVEAHDQARYVIFSLARNLQLSCLVIGLQELDLNVSVSWVK